MKTTSLVKVLGIATLAAAASIATSQAQTLIAHYEFNETSLTDPGNTGEFGPVVDSTGTQANADYVAIPGFNISTRINQAGPSGDKAFLFLRNTTYGVNTNQVDLLSATGDFSVLMSINTGYKVAGQILYLFSNNNNQAGRSDLYLQDGLLKWFHNGGVSLADTTDIADNTWHTVGIARENNDFKLIVDNNVVDTDSSAGAMSQTVDWWIGLRPTKQSPYDGYISDVKIYDAAVIPEPGTFVLLGLGLGALVLVRRRRH